MPIATNEQVQNFVNTRIRPRCEQIRALLYEMQIDKSLIDDIYAALDQENPTWVDNHNGHPPHMATPSDVLSINTLITNLITAIDGDAQKPIMLKLCVRDR